MPLFSIDEIFKSQDTKHRLTLFKPEDVKWLETQLFEKNGKPYLKCLASDKYRPAKPEEIVRQLWIKILLEEYHYPKERIKSILCHQPGGGRLLYLYSKQRLKFYCF